MRGVRNNIGFASVYKRPVEKRNCCVSKLMEQRMKTTSYAPMVQECAAIQQLVV